MSLKDIAVVPLFSILIAAGAQFSFYLPGYEIPVVLANLFVILAGMMLGPQRAILSVGIYLVAGSFGLPVFSGFEGGTGILTGPKGGYLFGYVFAAAVSGLIMDLKGNALLIKLSAAILGMFSIFLVGIPILMLKTNYGLIEALQNGFYPFIVPGLIKAIMAVALLFVWKMANEPKNTP